MIEEDLVDIECKLATFDNLSAHITDENLRLLADRGIKERRGPPNGTDLWQPNDQLINKHFRRQMPKLITEHCLRNENNLTNDVEQTVEKQVVYQDAVANRFQQKLGNTGKSFGAHNKSYNS